jgi:hypothetical protein
MCGHDRLHACHPWQGAQRRFGRLMRCGKAARLIGRGRLDHETHNTALDRQRTNQIIAHQGPTTGRRNPRQLRYHVITGHGHLFLHCLTLWQPVPVSGKGQDAVDQMLKKSASILINMKIS